MRQTKKPAGNLSVARKPCFLSEIISKEQRTHVGRAIAGRRLRSGVTAFAVHYDNPAGAKRCENQQYPEEVGAIVPGLRRLNFSITVAVSGLAGARIFRRVGFLRGLRLNGHLRLCLAVVEEDANCMCAYAEVFDCCSLQCNDCTSRLSVIITCGTSLSVNLYTLLLTVIVITLPCVTLPLAPPVTI